MDLSKDDEFIVAAITTLWDFHLQQVSKSISKIIEANENILLSNFHLNVTKAYCLDVVIVAGLSSAIYSIIKSFREIKDIAGIDFVLMSPIPEHKSH